MTEADIRQYLMRYAENEEMERYIRIHSRRFAYLLQQIKAVRSQLPDTQIRILDIGPSFFTQLLTDHFVNDEVSTLGFISHEALGGHLSSTLAAKMIRHTTFDLNDTQYPERCPKMSDYHIIVMAEVLEHLYTSPLHIYRFLHSISTGYLIIGTPNAVTLRNRALMMLGKNPFEQIRETRDNPGHFREYTVNELRNIGISTGWEAKQLSLANYFSASSTKGKMFDFLTGNLMPKSFRTGITAIYKKI